MSSKPALAFLLILVATTLQAQDKATPKHDTIRFYDGKLFTIIGRYHTEDTYTRFPEKFKATLRPDVWDLGQNSAGIGIRFRSNATYIRVKWTLKNDTSFPHMAPTGIKGVDLYANANATWQFIQTGRPTAKTSEYVLVQHGAAEFREYLLNLPLYDGVDSVSIGVNENADITRPRQDFLLRKKPVVYYGSSIAQGGCASRPGMAFTSILSRKLDRPFINLGFSGSGTFDASVGDAMSEVDAALYVIDCNPNTEKDLIYDRCVALVKLLRKNRPTVPVLLVENFIYDHADILQERSNQLAKRKELKRAYETLKKSGVTNLYYETGDGMIGKDHEGTVDGVHPTDLGMLRIADYLLPEIQYILSE